MTRDEEIVYEEREARLRAWAGNGAFRGRFADLENGIERLRAVAEAAFADLQAEIYDDPAILHGGRDLFDALKAAGYEFALPDGWTWDMIEPRTTT